MSITNEISSTDITRYEFNDNEYIHSTLVAAVVSDFVATHNDIAYEELCSVFPSQLQGNKGVFAAQEALRQESISTRESLTGPCDTIKLKDCTIHICAAWENDNITRFIDHVTPMGYEISTVDNCYQFE